MKSNFFNEYDSCVEFANEYAQKNLSNFVVNFRRLA